MRKSSPQERIFSFIRYRIGLLRVCRIVGEEVGWLNTTGDTNHGDAERRDRVCPDDLAGDAAPPDGGHGPAGLPAPADAAGQLRGVAHRPPHAFRAGGDQGAGRFAAGAAGGVREAILARRGLPAGGGVRGHVAAGGPVRRAPQPSGRRRAGGDAAATRAAAGEAAAAVLDGRGDGAVHGPARRDARGADLDDPPDLGQAPTVLTERRVKRIVLTGGPGAGKTSVAAALARAMPERLVHVPEAATRVYGQLGTRW